MGHSKTNPSGGGTAKKSPVSTHLSPTTTTIAGYDNVEKHLHEASPIESLTLSLGHHIEGIPLCRVPDTETRDDCSHAGSGDHDKNVGFANTPHHDTKNKKRANDGSPEDEETLCPHTPNGKPIVVGTDFKVVRDHGNPHAC